MGEEIGDTPFGLQVSIGFVGILLTQIVGFIGSIFLARVIGPQGYGLFYVSLGVAKFFQKPVDGWSAACRKRVSEADFDTGEALGAVLSFSLPLLSSGPLSPTASCA